MIASILILILGISAVSADTYTCDTSASCGCLSATVSVTARIVGGQDAPSHAWPWMLSLQYNQKHICGATLITPTYAITSAHCLSTNTAVLQNMTIFAGTNYLDDSGSTVQRRSLEAIYIHPGFNYSAFANDFAMVRFAALTVGPSAFVSSICYPAQGQDPFVTGQNLIALGWGVTAYDSAIIVNDLRQVTVQAVDTNSVQCKNASVRDPVARFCAGVTGGGKDTCQGDSGGPLMALNNNRWYVAGVPTSGRGCGRDGFPGVYTRISQFASYIQSVFDNPNSATIQVPPPGSGSGDTSSSSTTPSTSSSTSQGGGSGNSGVLPQASVYFYVLSLVILMIFQ